MKKVITSKSQISTLPVYTIILGVLSLTFSSCATQRGIRLRNQSVKEWKSYQMYTIKEDNLKTWSINSRKIQGTNFFEYQITGDINAPAEASLAAFKQDIVRQANDLDNKKYPTYEIISESKDSLLTYVIHNEPFPLKDTEMMVKYHFHYNKSGNTGVHWHEDWDLNPVQATKKLKRVETFRGSWDFVAKSAVNCIAINSVQFDPKEMPRWLYQPMVIKFLKNGLKTLREDTFNSYEGYNVSRE